MPFDALEMAHILGFDRGVRQMPVQVKNDFDTFQGKIVDVDYASTGWTRPKAGRSGCLQDDASGEEAGRRKARWACETSRCASMPANARDPYTGAAL